jgi:hypothetical protein
VARKKKSGGASGSAELTMNVDSSAVDKAAKDLRGAMDDQVAGALRRLGEDFVSETRRKLKAGPGAGKYGTRSREKAAAGVGFDVKSGKLVLESTGGNQPAEHRGFAAFYSQRSWSHPVYGGRARVSQRGAGTWWEPKSYEKRAGQLLADAAQRAADKVDK